MRKFSVVFLAFVILLTLNNPVAATGSRSPWADSQASPYGDALAAPVPAASLVVGVPDEDVGSIADAGVIDLLYGVQASGLVTSTSEYFRQTATTGASETNDNYGYAVTSGDFNNDGYYDIAIGVPYESDGVYLHSGAVNVLYGSAGGFTHQEFWFASDITDLTIADDDHFGWAVAAGDFDGDGYDDLAIGAPDYDCCGYQDSGLVVMLYGSRSGLGRVNAAFNNLSGTVDIGGHFGWALASADFDGDGYDDLAIGAPDETSNGSTASGGNVAVRYGAERDAGIVTGTTLSQSNSGQGVSEDGDRFGYSLAVGDFNTDGYPDIAVGAPGEDIGSLSNAGTINVFYSDGAGDFPAGRLWYQDLILGADSNPQNASEAGDQFGYSLASGDFDHDGHADLAIGAPFEDNGFLTDVGIVQVIFGTTASGLDDAKSALFMGGYWHNEQGYALAAGDFDGDLRDDLAMGQPLACSSGSRKEDGVILIYYGDSTTDNGFSSTKHQEYSQADMPPVAAEDYDHFGAVLAVLPPPRPPKADSLIIGVPYEDIGSTGDAGVIDLIHGDPGRGLDNASNESFAQTATAGISETGDEYGYAIASGDFNSDGYYDIAIGVPYESDATHSHAGAVNVLYGSAAGFTRQEYWFASDITSDIVGDGDHFGWSLAVGDFDNDGYDDLAVGAPWFDVYGNPNITEAGMVAVLYGGSGGLERVTAAFNNLSGDDANGHFGWSLAAADFNADGYDDLAIGVPDGLDDEDTVRCGYVEVWYGTARDNSGISGTTLAQSDTGQGSDADGDQFGYTLATGDFNADDHPDLAIGIPGRDIGAAANAGAVIVVYDLSSLDSQLWYQDIIKAPDGSTPQDPSEAGDQFGYSLTSGDFDADEGDDLAIGVPYENDNGTLDAGMVQVLFGMSETGLGDAKSALFVASQGNSVMGYALAAGDFDGDGCDELAAGMPGASSDGHTADGGLLVVYGDATATEGFSISRYETYNQDNLPFVAPEDYDRFGIALAVLPPPLYRIYLPLVIRN